MKKFRVSVNSVLSDIEKQTALVTDSVKNKKSRINYGKLQRGAQMAVIYTVVLSGIGIMCAVLHIALLYNSVYIPETFIGLIAGTFIVPSLVKKLRSVLP